MDMLSNSFNHSSHPVDRPWDRPDHVENDRLIEKSKDLIKELFTPSDTKPSSSERRHIDPAHMRDLSTYSSKYQQFARKAEKGVLNKKCQHSVDNDLSESEEIGTSEADHSHLEEEIQSLEKLHGDIIAGKREYIAKGEEKFEHFEYPSNNSFKSIKKEEAELAKQKQAEYLAINTNIQLSLQQGLGRMDTSLTTTEGFQSIKNLVDQGNLKEDREELSTFLNSLNAYLQDHSSKATSQKGRIWEYLQENRWIVAKQISKANQRFKDAEDYVKTNDEKIVSHLKIAKNSEKSEICDTYLQAMERVQQTRERAKNAEGQYREADERAKQAVKRIEQAKKFGMKEAIEAAEASFRCAKEVASLARELAENEYKLAEDIEKWANKLKTNYLSHNPEEEKEILEKEEKSIEDSKKDIEFIKFRQEQESEILRKEIEALKIIKEEVTIENSILKRENEKEVLNYSKSVITKIDKSI